MHRAVVLGAVLAAAALLASAAQAADEGLVLRQSAERLAAAERCEEAIDKARRARALAPQDALAAAIEGRCALHLKRYEEAAAPLEQARRLAPSMPGLSADLAMTHYHRGDLEAASRELDLAEKESPDDPRVLLYRGLLHLDRSEDVQAATVLERAARMDPGIDPLASYYAALAWERAREREKAREALAGVQSRSPSSPWADEARSALARLDAAADLGPGRWWATATAGAEWDDNVVLRGDGIDLPDRISDDEDVRGFWSVELGSELLRTKNWAAGAIAGYHGNAHVDLHDFDLQYPTASVWIDRRVDDKSFLRLQPFYGYAWTSTDPYLSHGGATLSYHRSFDDAGSGRLYGQYSFRNYLFNTQGTLDHERDRDGHDVRGGYEHSLAVSDSTTLRGGIAYRHYAAEGGEYDHNVFGGHVGVRQALPARFILDAEGSYTYEPYNRASSFPDPSDIPKSPKRRDNVSSVRVLLERPITDWLSLAAHWRYIDNDSNTRVFDYDRHIVGGYFTLSYGP